MKKVAYVTGDFSEVHKELLLALNSRGIKAKLFYHNRKKVLDESENTFDTLFYYFDTLSRGPFLFLRKHDRVAEYFENNLMTNEVDIIHGNMVFTDGYICRRISNKYNIPFVVTCRNTDIYAWFFWILPWIKRAGINNLLDSKAVIFLSEAYKEKLIRKIPIRYRREISDKSHVIPNGINTFWLDNKYNKDRVLENAIRFITVGRIEKNKNQIRIAKAIQKYKVRYGKQVEYVVVGSCSDTGLKKELMKYDFVQIKDHMDKELLINEYRMADIYIMPSHHESFGLVYPEAMSQGLPVIYSKGQGFDQQFEDGLVGRAVDSRNTDDIVAGIAKVVDDYKKLSKNALDSSSIFDWNLVSEKLIDIYNSCME